MAHRFFAQLVVAPCLNDNAEAGNPLTRSFSRATPRPEDLPVLQADRCFPPVNPFLKTTNGRVEWSNLAANRLHRI